MEGKDVVRALLWAAVVFFVWQMIAVRVWPPTPVNTDRTPAEVASEDGGERARPTPSGGAAPTRAQADPGDGALYVLPSERETITLGSTDGGESSPFRMGVSLTTVGAALVEAELSDFEVSAEPDAPSYPMVKEETSDEGETLHSFTTDRIYIGEWDETVALGGVAWAIESRDAERVVFRATIQDGDKPVLHVRKTFALPVQPAESQRHDMAIVYDIENVTHQPLTAIITQRGPVGMRKEDLRFNDRFLFSGVFGEEGVLVEQTAMNATGETSLYRSDDAEPVAWIAVANKYFVVFASPRAEDGHAHAAWVNEIKSVPVTTEGPTSTFVTTTSRLAIEPGARREVAFDLYLGPKDRKAFRSVPEYAALGYDEQVLSSYSMGACAFLTPKSFVRFMIWMLNSLKAMVFNYGIAIIILVLIVRTILHPITKKGQVNMMRMQQQQANLAPKMEEIKKRCANDKQKMNQEIMAMYKDEGVNPMTGMMSSCLPMFLQMPIWVALFTSLNFNIDMRHEPFMLWIHDLTAPDALIRFADPVHVPILSSMTGPITSFNLLPILVSLSMFMQQKLMPKPKPAPGPQSDQSEQAAQMQKMMPYMTLVFGLFFYNMPSGLNLYIGASSVFGAIEQYRIRKHIEELKKQPAPVKHSRDGDGGGGRPAKPKKPKGPSFFGKLQKAAEEAQKVKSARPKAKMRKR